MLLGKKVKELERKVEALEKLVGAVKENEGISLRDLFDEWYYGKGQSEWKK